MLENTRSQWMNASKQLFAFCSTKQERVLDVRRFQQTAARLFSLMFCTMAMETATAPFEFEVLDLHLIDPHAIAYLEGQHSKYEIVHSWIQRYIIVAVEEGVLTAPPPIISRVFQDLGHGMRDARSMIKLQVPFPYPYAQVITWLLLTHSVASPIITACLLSSVRWTVTLTFINVTLFWCILYIAGELENPFGNDANDLPLLDMQKSFNASLGRLIDPRVQNVPRFRFDNGKLESWELSSRPYWSVAEVLVGKAEAFKQPTASLYEGCQHERSELFKQPAKSKTQLCEGYVETKDLREVFASGASMKRTMSLGKDLAGPPKSQQLTPPTALKAADLVPEALPPQEQYQVVVSPPPGSGFNSPTRAATNEALRFEGNMQATSTAPEMRRAASSPMAMDKVKTGDAKTLNMLKKKKRAVDKAGALAHVSNLGGDLARSPR